MDRRGAKQQIEEQRRRVNEQQRVLDNNAIRIMEDDIQLNDAPRVQFQNMSRWRRYFKQITGMDFSFQAVFLLAFMAYVVVIQTGLDQKVSQYFKSLISEEAKRMLNDRGQFVASVHDYQILAKAEWRNVHESLKRVNPFGNEKMPLIKLTVKTTLMEKFKGATLDEVYIMLHKVCFTIDGCYALALANGKKNSNQFTNDFSECMFSGLK